MKKHLNLNEIKPEQVLAEDVAVNGFTLLAKGIALTDSVILSLKKKGIKEICIVDDQMYEQVSQELGQHLDERFDVHTNNEFMMSYKDMLKESLVEACRDGLYE